MAWTTATERVLQFDAEVFSRYIGTERICQAGDHEFYVVMSVTARDVAGTLAALDVSGAAAMTLVLVDPGGLLSRHALANRSSGTDGIIQYQIAAGELEEPGVWRLYCEIEFSTSVVTSQRSLLYVEGQGFNAPQKKK